MEKCFERFRNGLDFLYLLEYYLSIFFFSLQGPGLLPRAQIFKIRERQYTYFTLHSPFFIWES